VLTVKLRGGRSLEARTENVLQVSQALAMTVDQFYDSQAAFIKVGARLAGRDGGGGGVGVGWLLRPPACPSCTDQQVPARTLEGCAPARPPACPPR
jgi:hypothetical protein